MSRESKDRNTYKNIFKATALFSGVKIFQIFISIIRSKLVAMLIGPAGMGISNLLSSTIGTVNQLTGCGLQTSAVREIAKANESQDNESINSVITVLRFFVWLTGLIGFGIVFIFSDNLSRFAFGTTDYSLAFKFLSVNLVAMQLNVGQMALLQGTFRYKDIAKASLWGQIVGLVITIPIYYYLREKGIVPVLIITALISLFFSWSYSRKIQYIKVKMSLRELFSRGKGLITLGVVLALGGVIGNLSSYVMNIFLSNKASLNEVGLYGAGVAIANTYIFTVLSAMSTDYVPRIAALSDNKEEQIKAINKQIELVTLIMLPLLIAMIVFVKEVVAVLYTKEFYPMASMLQLFMLGMFFQAITWCLSYAVVARGDSKVFLFTEIYNFIISISLKIIGYLLWDLVGIGIAFIIDYIFEFLLIWLVCRKKFGFSFSKECKKLIFAIFIACIISLCIMFLLQGIQYYIIGSVVFLCVCAFSLKELNKRIGILNFIKQRI